MQPQQTRPTPPSQQHGIAGRFHDERISPSMHGYTSPGSYSPGRLSPSGGPGAKKSRMLPQLPPGRESMGKPYITGTKAHVVECTKNTTTTATKIV